MESTYLHTKYRPKTLDEFRGHENLKASLRGILSGDEAMPHTIIFGGPRGCGKTTLGRIIANHVQCDPLDLLEIDAGVDRGIGNIRELIEQASLRPLYGPTKVYIIDEAAGLTTQAQDALLKTLEDGCPSHTYFVLCSTDPEKIKQTIRSRCAQYRVSRLGEEILWELICDVCEAEGWPENNPSPEVMDVALRYADGTPREALVNLAMVKDFTDAKKAEELLSSGFGSEAAEFVDLLDTLKQAVSSGTGVEKVMMKYRKLPERDPFRVRFGLVEHFRRRLVEVKTEEAAAVAANMLQFFARSFSAEMAEAELVLDIYLAVTQNK